MIAYRVASGEWRVASGEWRVASGEKDNTTFTCVTLKEAQSQFRI
ncbi:hypothetical protein [Vibrio brasiliensis]